MRPALLWTIRLDPEGSRTDVEVERALVRSTAKLTYQEAQQAIDDGSAGESLQLLKEVGLLRVTREAARGGISLPTLEQEVHVAEERFSLEFREMLPVETWNAQLSLLTGFAAASLMVYARVGLLRTLPDPDHRDVQRLHRTARALGIEWPAELLYADLIRELDPTKADQAALIVASTTLLRGSGYVAFDGEMPAEPRHAGLAAEYAHVTAPLRRLADRYASEVCVALCAGTTWPTGCTPRCPASRRRCNGPDSWQPATSGWCSTWSRPGCSRRTWGSRTTVSWSPSTTRSRPGGPSPSASRRSRRRWSRRRRCRWAPRPGCGSPPLT